MIQAMSTREVKREHRSDSDPSVAFHSSEFENVIQDCDGLREA